MGSLIVEITIGPEMRAEEDGGFTLESTKIRFIITVHRRPGVTRSCFG